MGNQTTVRRMMRSSRAVKAFMKICGHMVMPDVR